MKRKIIMITGLMFTLLILLTACTGSGDAEDTGELDEAKLKDSKIEEVQVKDIKTENLIEATPEESEGNDRNQVPEDHTEEQELKLQLEELKKENEELSEVVNNMYHSNQQQNILYKSLEVMEAIKTKDFQELSNHIHPSKGVKFSPYFFVDPPNHQVLTSQDIANLSQNNTLYNWGTFDGTGDPIDLNFNDYYDRFIYDEDYLNAHMIGINTPIGMGNIMDNVSIEYPDGEYVEYHFTGFDPQYDGMDWRSLRLVFEQSGGIWYLVGIVHGEWTT